jgi:hypothetical protein
VTRDLIREWLDEFERRFDILTWDLNVDGRYYVRHHSTAFYFTEDEAAAFIIGLRIGAGDGLDD